MKATPIWLLNTLLALVVLVVFRWPVSVPEFEIPAEKPKPVQEIAASPVPALDAYSVITERPLFRPDRRPPAPPPEEPEPAPPQIEAEPVAEPAPPPGGRLHGVISDGHAWIVLYQPDAQSEVVRLKEGELLGPWRITKAQPHAIVLEHGERQHTLLLRPDR